MKLITLNIWGGRVKEALPPFFEKYNDVDVFCFQEVYKNADGKVNDDEYREVSSLNLFGDLSKMLPNHIGHFRPAVKDHYGLAIFVNKDLRVIEEGDVWVYKPEDYVSGGNHPRNLQYVKVLCDGKELLIANLHGIWSGGTSKRDTPERIEQSNKTLEFLAQHSGPTILAGDFNLRPETESIKILENKFENLISKYGICSTRTSHYKKECKFADYVLLNNEVKDTNLTVLPEEVSDHSALLLDFELHL